MVEQILEREGNRRKKPPVLTAAVMMLAFLILCSRNAWGENNIGWEKLPDGWVYRQENDGKQIRNEWVQMRQEWYHFGPKGIMDTGWKKINGYWYFFYPGETGEEGRMMTGWQWVDGRCYYLSEEKRGLPEGRYPYGAMYAGEKTPDGYPVNTQGAWTDELGNVVSEEGKGISSGAGEHAIARGKKGSGGSAPGGKGTPSGSGSAPGSQGNPSGGVGVPGSQGNPSGSGSAPGSQGNPSGGVGTPGSQENVSGSQEGGDDVTGSHGSGNGTFDPPVRPEFHFTIRCMNCEDQSVISLICGKGSPNSAVEVELPEIEGFELCEDQKIDFILTSEDQEFPLYYEKLEPATPSEAVKVHWQIFFTEENHQDREIFPSQEGKSEVGTRVMVDFPEVILGRDGCRYNAITGSPMTFYVEGSGNQKFYVGFIREEVVSDDEDQEKERKERLKNWIQTAARAEQKITGRLPENGQVITGSVEESEERIKNLVSMTDDTERHIIYLVAKNHIPSPLTIGEMSAWNVDVSWQEEDEFIVDQNLYRIVRASFARTFSQVDCSHNWELTSNVTESCLSGGSIFITCKRCGQQETAMLPPVGHRDEDQDGICEVCYEETTGKEEVEAVFYQEGDVQIRKLGGELYLFRCIDEDYSDSGDNRQSLALFLCDRVLRSDIDSTTSEKKALSFGQNNNYKTSKIRSWLVQNGERDLYGSSTCYIGLNAACTGATKPGAYEQLDETDISFKEKPFQLIEDRIFILSAEEALRYREYLWKFNGSGENNPLTQYSAYSRGYYLRTPRYEEEGGKFRYGKEIYAVDLVNGNIHTVQTEDASIGIRPAYALPQA